ncbi:hypothetical protein B0A48_07988 [Cryoendolithus antarcticus]|uniref:Uncharacterized protein n=1 Tax=Cryoendolithus antarcticus TaxID=1507870 RepID=A0A1V8T0W8_9PEZI|nr:hypothetical protein B0A48_07988 [Cryoendolithus antarcticus]
MATTFKHRLLLRRSIFLDKTNLGKHTVVNHVTEAFVTGRRLLATFKIRSHSVRACFEDLEQTARGRSRKPSESYSGPKAEVEWTGNEIRADVTEAGTEDPLFKDYYHETGYIISASRPETIQELYEDEQPTPENGFVEINTAA